MASVGPQLPPSLAVKRKRDEESDAVNDHSHTSTPPQDRPATPDSAAKRPRTIGPTLPPASLDTRPADGPDGDSDTSSDDDDFGPSLPGPGASPAGSAERTVQALSETGPQVPGKSQRDEWMIVPPSNSDWSARVDPTKLKARKFNTGKGATASSHGATTGGDNKWTETPAEKLARLEREMMGIADPTAAKAPPRGSLKPAPTSPKLREYNEKARAPSLYNEHQKSNPREEEDDPSARPFDREKDIAAGMTITTTQRKEMMKRAADFGSRFSSAKYL